MNPLQSNDNQVPAPTNSDGKQVQTTFEPTDAGSGVEGSGADANAGQQSEY